MFSTFFVVIMLCLIPITKPVIVEYNEKSDEKFNLNNDESRPYMQDLEDLVNSDEFLEEFLLLEEMYKTLKENPTIEF